MTYEEIQAAIAKQINYIELARLLELDLNSIAEEIITDPSDIIEFEVFFDSGEFQTKIEQYAVGEGSGFQNTPILLKFINGDYNTAKGPNFFSTVFSIEVLGFEKDRENLRKIFETYSYLNQGLIDKDDLGVYITKTLEFPYFDAPFQYNGAERLQGFMRLFLNYMYINGQMSNEVIVKIDNNEVSVNGLQIQRSRNLRSEQMNTQAEITNIHESQSISISGSMIYDGSTAAKKIIRNIKTLTTGINQGFSISIKYPNIITIVEEEEVADEDTYSMILDNGSISITEGGVITMNFTFLLKEVS